LNYREELSANREDFSWLELVLKAQGISLLDRGGVAVTSAASIGLMRCDLNWEYLTDQPASQ
jgi:hypothetical protein